MSRGGRPRAGNGWTAIRRGDKLIWLILDDSGHWRTTGEAVKWPRCTRCRRPHEHSPFESGMCPICYYYKAISTAEFWKHDQDWLFPYRIGERGMQATDVLSKLQDARNWRAVLKSQVH